MKHANSKKIYAYWDRLRGSRPAPDRREIEPGDIRDMLGETFILEIDPLYGNISFRLAGTRLCNAYGRELKGRGFLSIWEEKDNMKMYDLVRKVYMHKLPGLVSYQSISANGKSAECEMALFPLMNGQETAGRILGSSFRFHDENNTTMDVIERNLIQRLGTIETVPASVTPPLAPKAFQGFGRQNAGNKTFGHLTVIEGGRQG